MKSLTDSYVDDYRLRLAWSELSAERQEYFDIFHDYIPRGQVHFKLKREYGYGRLSIRSMHALLDSARAGDKIALKILAGNVELAHSNNRLA